MKTFQNINTINQLRGSLKLNKILWSIKPPPCFTRTQHGHLMYKAVTTSNQYQPFALYSLAMKHTLYNQHLVKFSKYLTCWVRLPPRARCTTLRDIVCQWLATGRWFSPGPRVSSTNTTDCYDITEILLKVALNTIKPNLKTNLAFHVHFTLSILSPSIIPPKHSQQILTLNTHEIKIRSVIHKNIF